MANRERAKKMAARGSTAKEIRQTTGVTGQAARNIVSRTKAPAAAPATTASKPPTLGQGLRIAGGGGGVGGKELDTLVSTKTSPDEIIRRLDKINDKLAGKDQTGINVKSGAYNKLARKVRRMSPFERSQLDFGSGRLGMQIQGMLGTPGTPGYMRQGQMMGGSAGVEPSFLPKGMDLNPRGKQVVRGVGKQYEVPQRLMGQGTATDGTATGDTVGDGTAEAPMAAEPIIPEPPMEEPVDTSLSSGAGGLDLASWATGFKRAKSSRQRGGKGAQGLASMKKSPFQSWFK